MKYDGDIVDVDISSARVETNNSTTPPWWAKWSVSWQRGAACDWRPIREGGMAAAGMSDVLESSFLSGTGGDPGDCGGSRGSGGSGQAD